MDESDDLDEVDNLDMESRFLHFPAKRRGGSHESVPS